MQNIWNNYKRSMKIKPIVQQTCKEFDIPYVHFDSVFSALLSGLENYSNVANL